MELFLCIFCDYNLFVLACLVYTKNSLSLSTGLVSGTFYILETIKPPAEFL